MQCLNDILKAQKRAKKFQEMEEEQKNPRPHRKGRRIKGTRQQKKRAYVDSLKNDQGKIEVPERKRTPKSKRSRATLGDYIATQKRDGKQGVKVAEMPWETRRRQRKELRRQQRRTWNSLWKGREIGYTVPDGIPPEVVPFYKKTLAERFIKMRRGRNFGQCEGTLIALEKKYC